jgi:hypothetical protein
MAQLAPSPKIAEEAHLTAVPFLDRLVSPKLRQWYEQQLATLLPDVRLLKVEALDGVTRLLSDDEFAAVYAFLMDLCVQAEAPALGIRPQLPARLEALALLFSPLHDDEITDQFVTQLADHLDAGAGDD